VGWTVSSVTVGYVCVNTMLFQVVAYGPRVTVIPFPSTMLLGPPTYAHGVTLATSAVPPLHDMNDRVFTIVRTALVLVAMLVVDVPVGPSSCGKLVGCRGGELCGGRTSWIEQNVRSETVCDDTIAERSQNAAARAPNCLLRPSLSIDRVNSRSRPVPYEYDQGGRGGKRREGLFCGKGSFPPTPTRQTGHADPGPPHGPRLSLVPITAAPLPISERHLKQYLRKLGSW